MSRVSAGPSEVRPRENGWPLGWHISTWEVWYSSYYARIWVGFVFPRIIGIIRSFAYEQTPWYVSTVTRLSNTSSSKVKKKYRRFAPRLPRLYQ